MVMASPETHPAGKNCRVTLFWTKIRSPERFERDNRKRIRNAFVLRAMTHPGVLIGDCFLSIDWRLGTRTGLCLSWNGVLPHVVQM